MAANFVAASTQYLINSAPIITDYPFSCGAWVRLASTGMNRHIFALYNSADTTHVLGVRVSNAGVPQLVARAGGTLTTNATTTAITSNWTFLLSRFVTATDRQLSVLLVDGSIETASSATNRAPTGMNTLTIGDPTALWDGLIGEFWMTNTNIFPTGGSTDANLVQQLAYGGPFSVPHVGANVIEYMAMRAALPTHPMGDGHYCPRGPQAWVNTNGVTIGQHPPLPYWYEKPRSVVQTVIV